MPLLLPLLLTIKGTLGKRLPIFPRFSAPDSQPEVVGRVWRPVRAPDEMTVEASQTCLVAISSALEESTANISFLCIIHENRKTADSIRTTPLSRESNYCSWRAFYLARGGGGRDDIFCQFEV